MVDLKENVSLHALNKVLDVGPAAKTSAPIGGQHSKYELVDPKLIKFDRISDGGYQREYDPKRIKNMADNFDNGKFEYPMISRRANGDMFCVGGQHRTLTFIEMQRRYPNYPYFKLMPVQMFEGMTREREAELFAAYDIGRKGLHAVERFFASLKCGEPNAVKCKLLLDECGLEVRKTSKNLNAIACIEEFRKAMRVDEEALRNVMLQLLMPVFRTGPEYPAIASYTLSGLFMLEHSLLKRRRVSKIYPNSLTIPEYKSWFKKHDGVTLNRLCGHADRTNKKQKGAGQHNRNVAAAEAIRDSINAHGRRLKIITDLKD